MPRKPTVSVIIPTHNDAEYLSESLASVVDQTFDEWEMWVIDDGSCQEMANRVDAVIAHYQMLGYEIQIIRHSQPKGAAAARNSGIEAATGQYIAFLDADDAWLPQKLEIQISFMRENNVAFSFSSYEKIKKTPQGLMSAGVVQAPEYLSYSTLLKGCVIGCLTVIYDAHILGKRYMPNLPCSQDYALWLSILREQRVGHGVPQTLSRYTVRKGSLSANKWRKIKYHWWICRRLEKLSLLTSLQSLVLVTVHSLVKRYSH